MNTLRLYRILTSVVALGLSIAVIVQLVRLLDALHDILGRFTVPPYIPLGIAVGSITICASLLMIVLDFFAVNALMSAIAFEIGWTGKISKHLPSNSPPQSSHATVAGTIQ
ncbi:hypothetical protein C8Q79DRAFT_1010619 [Trametes meyenii]|nr:hypothetical protein C8Q79DRAFT_1010619 [Trametes meyenii]